MSEQEILLRDALKVAEGRIVELQACLAREKAAFAAEVERLQQRLQDAARVGAVGLVERAEVKTLSLAVGQLVERELARERARERDGSLVEGVVAQQSRVIEAFNKLGEHFKLLRADIRDLPSALLKPASLLSDEGGMHD